MQKKLSRLQFYKQISRNKKTYLQLCYSYIIRLLYSKKILPKNWLKDASTNTFDLHLNGNDVQLFMRWQDLAIFNEVFYEQAYQLSDFVKEDPVIVVDMGAHIGLASLYFCQQFKNIASFFCIEPAQDNFKILSKNLKNYPCTFVNKAIANTTGSAQLKTDDLGFNYSLNNQASDQTIEVSTCSISELMRSEKIKRIDLLKIDIEGGEAMLFHEHSDLSWLDMVSNIVIEIHSQENLQLFQSAMNAHHFEVQCLHEEDMHYFASSNKFMKNGSELL